MSIYIQGMEMPKYGRCITIWTDGRITTEFGSYTIGNAIFLSDHGRLIDADKLERGLRQMAKYQTGERRQGILGCCETIRLAKTIIPADKEDEA